nr:proteoglycan 4-like isoform X1 [Misgurnus anguillicaudatus]
MLFLVFLFLVRLCLYFVRLCVDFMNRVIVFLRPGRFSRDKFLSGLDNGSTLLFIKKNRPVVTIRRDLSAHKLTVPSVPEFQEEALGEPCGQRERETEDAEPQSSVSGAVAPQTPAVQTAEEACPEEKTMIEDEDFEEEASESSSLHESSSMSGSGSDSSSLIKGSSSVVADGSEDEPLAIQPAACLPWIGRVVSRADLEPPAPTKDGPPSAPPVVTAEEACPEEKTMIEDEDFEEEASESSSLHESSSLSGSGSDSSSLIKGSSSVVADGSGDEPLAIQPAACLPWIGRVVSRADLKPPAPRKGFPQWSDLWNMVDLNGSREESTPPDSACTHQENSTETKDLKARAEILVSELVRFSGCGFVSAEFRFKLGQMLVSFALTSEAACTLARETLDREMLRLRKEENSPQTLIHLYRFIKRFPMIFIGMKCQLHQFVLEDLEDPDLVSEDEDGPAEIAPANPSAEGPLLPAPLAVPEPPPGLLFFPAPEPAPQPSVEVLSFPAPLADPEPPPGLLFFSAPAPAPQFSVEVLSSPPPAPAPQPSVEGLSFPAPLAVPEPPPGLLFFPAPTPAPQPSVEGLSFPAPLAVPEPPPGLLFFPAPTPAPQPSVEVLSSPSPAPQPSVEVLSSPPPAPAPQFSVEVLSFPAPLAVPEPPPGLLFFPASEPVEVLSSCPPASAPQLSVEVLSSPPPASAPNLSVEVISSSPPPPAPAPQPSCGPPQLQIPPFYKQKNADAVKDVEVGNRSSSSELSPPLASPPSRKRRAPSSTEQSIRVQREVSPKRARLCPSSSDIKAQHSSPYSLSVSASPPQLQTPPSFQYTDKIEDMEVGNTPSSSQLLPPRNQSPSPASPSLPPSRKRRAPSSTQDEMEPAPKRARVYGLSARVTPPLSQTPSSSQQIKVNATEVNHSSISQPSSNHNQKIQQVPPPKSPPRRCCKRPAPCSSQEASEGMVSMKKKPRLNGLF